MIAMINRLGVKLHNKRHLNQLKGIKMVVFLAEMCSMNRFVCNQHDLCVCV